MLFMEINPKGSVVTDQDLPECKGATPNNACQEVKRNLHIFYLIRPPCICWEWFNVVVVCVNVYESTVKSELAQPPLNAPFCLVAFQDTDHLPPCCSFRPYECGKMLVKGPPRVQGHLAL